MGLDCSHDAFHGAYSAFNRLRQMVCFCLGNGASFPPHYEYNADGSAKTGSDGWLIRRPDYADSNIYFDDDDVKEDSGLYCFLTHSDCDGEISPEMCIKVADELESKVLPKLEALPDHSGGHIAREGGYAEVLRKFIKGCRAAAAECEPLLFH